MILAQPAYSHSAKLLHARIDYLRAQVRRLETLRVHAPMADKEVLEDQLIRTRAKLSQAKEQLHTRTNIPLRNTLLSYFIAET